MKLSNLLISLGCFVFICLGSTSLWAGSYTVTGEPTDMVPAQLDGDAATEYYVVTDLGRLYAFDDDHTLMTSWGVNPLSGLGYTISVAAGDINNDGLDDAILGGDDSSTNKLHVYSGADGAALVTKTQAGLGSLWTDASPDSGNYVVQPRYCHIVTSAQLDGDASMEFVAATAFGCILAYDGATEKWQYVTSANVSNGWRIIGLCTDEDIYLSDNIDDVVFTVTEEGCSYAGGGSGDGVIDVNRLYLLSGATGAVATGFPVDIGSATQAYEDVKVDNVCLVDSTGDGNKDRIAVGCSDGLVRYYNFSGTNVATSTSVTSAVVSVEARDTTGTAAEETLVGTKQNGVYCFDAAGTSSLWNKPMDYVFRITNQSSMTDTFTSATENEKYVIGDDNSTVYSNTAGTYAYSSHIVDNGDDTYDFVYISYGDTKVYTYTYTTDEFASGTAYVGIPQSSGSVTSLVSSGVSVKNGQSIPYVAFDFEFFQNGSSETSAKWKKFRVDKYSSASTVVPDDKIEVQVWEETNGNGYWDVGDTFVSKGNFTDGTVWLNMKKYNLTGAHVFYIVCKLEDDIGGGQSFGVKVTDETYIELEETTIEISARNW